MRLIAETQNIQIMLNFLVTNKSEIILIASFLMLTGVPVWVTHYLFDRVSGFPKWVSLLIHLALFLICYVPIKLIFG